MVAPGAAMRATCMHIRLVLHKGLGLGILVLLLTLLRWTA
jgi:hypothetical protein